MQDERRAVLERVASGELSPAEAASLLEERETTPDEPAAAPEADPRDWARDWERQPDWAQSSPPPPPSGEGVAARIRVLRSLGTADIIGDPSVREAVAEGPHVARREGDTPVIEGQDDAHDIGAGFMFGWPQDRHRMRRMRHRRGRWREMPPP